MKILKWKTRSWVKMSDLNFKGKPIYNQDQKILTLESSHSGNSELNEEEFAFDPIYIDPT